MEKALNAKHSKKIALFGVAGFNRGDDAITASIIQMLDLKYGAQQWLISVQREGIFKSDLINEILLSRKSISYHLKIIIGIARSDLIIIGGGSIIQDEFGCSWFKGIISIYAEIVFIAKIFRRPVITAPIGVDQLHSKTGEKIAKYILNGCSQIFVRDNTSFQHANNLRKKDIPLFLACDPVITYQPKHIKQQSNTLILSPAFEGKNESVLFKIHEAAIISFLKFYPTGKCVVVAMDDREKEDAGRIKAFLSSLDLSIQNKCALIIPKNHTEAATILTSGSCLLAMRLHAMILASGYLPVLCLSRSTKTDAISMELSIQKIDLNKNNDITTLTETIEKFFSTLNNYSDIEKSMIKTRLAKSVMAKKINIFVDSVSKWLS
jgi:polysaccharide pyruvyl transferase WcaK-like protein